MHRSYTSEKNLYFCQGKQGGKLNNKQITQRAQSDDSTNDCSNGCYFSNIYNFDRENSNSNLTLPNDSNSFFALNGVQSSGGESSLLSLTTEHSPNSSSNEFNEHKNESIETTLLAPYSEPERSKTHSLNCYDRNHPLILLPNGHLYNYSHHPNWYQLMTNRFNSQTAQHDPFIPALLRLRYNSNNNTHHPINNQHNLCLPFMVNDPNYLRYQRRSKKSRQPRTIFTKQQLSKLNKLYDKSSYLTSKERLEIAKELNLTQTQVKTWFQNKRSKIKKMILSHNS